MLICGPCSYLDNSQSEEIFETARLLSYIAEDNKIDIKFRVKIYCGGTTPVKWHSGIEDAGIPVLNNIQKFIPVGTEIQIPEHAEKCSNFDFIWVGARNCSNYGLLKAIRHFPKDILLKRSPGMSIDELIGLYDIMSQINERKVYIIERGVNTFDRLEDSRWSVDLKGAIRIKQERPDIFERFVVDLSHSSGKKEYIDDTYSAFQAIGVEHYMIEVMRTPELSKTDRGQILSIEEFRNLIGGWMLK